MTARSCMVLFGTTIGLLAILAPERSYADGAVEIVEVIVARMDIAPGTVIKVPEKMFKKVRYVKGDEPSTVKDIAKLKGRTVTRILAADQPVRPGDIGGLTTALLPGSRAVAVKIHREGALEYYALPGSLVDIICTTGAEEKVESKVILQKVRILAVNTYEDDLKKDKKESPVMVTLEVKLEEATKLTEAAEKGKLTLALRRLDEK